MSIIAAILVLALTRAEMLERMRAPVLVRANGLVKVFADCPEDMRQEYQSAVAGYAADTVGRLCSAQGIKLPKFSSPGIVLYVGDVRTNNPEVVVRVRKREGGGKMTRLYLMAPGYSDLERLRMELVKAFYLAVKGEEIDDCKAVREFRATDPRLRVADMYGELADWQAGKSVEGDDEKYLKLMRSVLVPGKATGRDILVFASRLFLYPEYYSEPFGGRYSVLSFADAVKLAADPQVRAAAKAKVTEVVAFGGGRSAELKVAAEAYSRFLFALSQGEGDEESLKDKLDDADQKLNIAFEAAKKTEERK